MHDTLLAARTLASGKCLARWVVRAQLPVHARAQMGVDTSRTEHIKISVDITFPALPCHGEPNFSAGAECPPSPPLLCAHTRWRHAAN